MYVFSISHFSVQVSDMLFLIIHDLCEVFILNNQLIGDEFLSPESRRKKYIWLQIVSLCSRFT